MNIIYNQLEEKFLASNFTRQLEDDIQLFSNVSELAKINLDTRLELSIKVFLEMLQISALDITNNVDSIFIDALIAKIDELLGWQIDEILHHPEFQRLEALWRSLKYLVDKIDFSSNIKVSILDISKDALLDDFLEAPDITHSLLFKQVYEKEYDTPGGEPVSFMVSDYELDASTRDLALLNSVAKVAASAHCPFFANIGPKFFGKSNIDEVAKIKDIKQYLERAEYINWNSFRVKEEARYIGLLFPRFLLRLPYGATNLIRGFNYIENVLAEHHNNFLWGAASFAFAANISKSFRSYGWALNIRGVEGGGKVEDLLLHQYDAGRGIETKIPSEIIISETRELDLADLGFIPLCYYKGSNFACFFSANSVHKPMLYDNHYATANSRINARLPYVLLVSRLGHYLKVIQRENIGTSKDRASLERELDRWLQTLVTEMDNPDLTLMGKRPLREAKVIVENIDNNPGYYKLNLYVRPHFQVEGIDVKLSLVSELPKEDFQ